MANDVTDASGTEGRSGGFLSDWLLPIGAGVVLGFLGLWGLRAAGVNVPSIPIFQNEVERRVAQWDWEDPDRTDELADEIAGLGTDARGDLRAAYLALDGEFPEHKAWVADLLLDEPFYDSRFLIDQATSGEGWDQRVAAVALVKHLGKKVDPSVVYPGLRDWLSDTETRQHGLAYGALGELLREEMLTTAQRDELRQLLLVLSDPAQRPAPEGEDDWLFVDLAGATHLLSHWIPDPEVEAHLRGIVLDESADFEPRISAIRALAESFRFDEVDFWAQAARAEHETVRQAVADNLYRTDDPAYDEVLARLHADAYELVRTGSIDSQIERGRPTPMAQFGTLIEDHSQWVRFHTLRAAAKFRDQPGRAMRLGAALRLLTEGVETDVEGAVLLLFAETGEHFGFDRLEVQERLDSLDDAAVEAFLADPEFRQQVRDQYAELLGDQVGYSEEERRAVLEELLEHPDPENRARAQSELAGDG